MRHLFATRVAELTHDPLLVRDLLGHASAATSEIDVLTSLEDARSRLAALGDSAANLLPRPKGKRP
jgi:site-specific recombinase XerC